MKFDCNHEFFIILFISFIYFFAAFSKRVKKSIWLFLLQMKLSFTLNGLCNHRQAALMMYKIPRKIFAPRGSKLKLVWYDMKYLVSSNLPLIFRVCSASSFTSWELSRFFCGIAVARSHSRPMITLKDVGSENSKRWAATRLLYY